jgi:flagellar basal-body rod modification protein FlgD
MIDGLSAPAIPTQTTGATGAGSSEMGKDEFLKLLVAQLKNQDPMNPSKPEEMAAQLAQFTSVEQLININDTLAAQAASNNSMAQALNNSAAVGVLGKTVLTVGDSVDVSGTGSDTVTAIVDGAGGDAVLTIYDADGTEVGSRTVPVGGGRQEIELGEAAEGLESGRYRYELTVTDAFGDPVSAQTFMRVQIDGLRYTSQGPVLTAGSIEIPLANVVEIIAQQD